MWKLGCCCPWGSVQCGHLPGWPVGCLPEIITERTHQCNPSAFNDYECINTEYMIKTRYTGCFDPNVLTLLFWSKDYFWIFGLHVYEYKNLKQIIPTLMNLSKAFYGPTFINHLNFSINFFFNKLIQAIPFLKFYLFNWLIDWLAVLGLSCGTQALRCGTWASL